MSIFATKRQEDVRSIIMNSFATKRQEDVRRECEQISGQQGRMVGIWIYRVINFIRDAFPTSFYTLPPSKVGKKMEGNFLGVLNPTPP